MPHWGCPRTEATFTLRPGNTAHLQIIGILKYLADCSCPTPLHSSSCSASIWSSKDWSLGYPSQILRHIWPNTYTDTCGLQGAKGVSICPFGQLSSLLGVSSGLHPLLLLSGDIRKLCWGCHSASLELRHVVRACVCVCARAFVCGYRWTVDMWEFFQCLRGCSWWQPVYVAVASWDFGPSLICSVH